MTSITTASHARPRRGHSRFATIAVASAGAATVAGLLMAALTFGALALAFPIAGPVAEQFHVSVPIKDALLAQEFAHFWWVFAGISIVTFLGALLVAAKSISYVGARDI